MSHQQFVYDDGLLQKCATSNFAARLLVSSATVNQRGSNRDDDDVKTTFVPDDTSCRRLFAQHAVHFGRRPAILLPNNEKDYKTRMHNFVRNVVFVYKHNAQNADVDASSSPQTSIAHRVGLNQFSDLRLSEILPTVLDDEEEADEAEAAAQKRHHHPPSRGSSRWLWEKAAAAALWEAQTNDNNNVKGIDVMESANFTLFSSRQQILDVAAANFMVMGNMGAGLPSSAHHPPEPFPLIAGPDDVSIKEDHGSDGSLLSINDINDQQGRTNRKKFDRQNNDDDDITPGATGFDDDNGKFATYLNWATTDNPDRVPLVNAPIDQVRACRTRTAGRVHEKQQGDHVLTLATNSIG
jgi:Cathepsin propeptide inhibitor domain (I29)